MANVKKVKKAQDGVDKAPSAKAVARFEARKAQVPVRKGASRTPIFGLKKAAGNVVLDDETGTMLKGFRMNGTKAEAYKKGGSIKKAASKKMVMKKGGTLSPSKKSVGKTIGKLNKAKYGSKTSKKK